MTSLPAGVIIDVEEVIAHYDLAITDAALERLLPGLTTERVNAARSGRQLYPLWLAYSVGRMAPEDYWSRVLAHVTAPNDPVSVSLYRAALADGWWGRLDVGVLEIIRELSDNRVPVALLSNSAADHDKQIQRLEPLVDVAHFSHRTGLRKPDAEAYLAVAEALNQGSRLLFFTDDKVRNVRGAEAVGMQAAVFTSAPDLRLKLAGFGLVANGVPAADAEPAD